MGPEWVWELLPWGMLLHRVWKKGWLRCIPAVHPCGALPWGIPAAHPCSALPWAIPAAHPCSTLHGALLRCSTAALQQRAVAELGELEL